MNSSSLACAHLKHYAAEGINITILIESWSIVFLIIAVELDSGPSNSPSNSGGHKRIGPFTVSDNGWHPKITKASISCAIDKDVGLERSSENGKLLIAMYPYTTGAYPSQISVNYGKWVDYHAHEQNDLWNSTSRTVRQASSNITQLLMERTHD